MMMADKVTVFLHDGIIEGVFSSSQAEHYSAITVNTGSTLQRFLDEPERWAVAPMSIIH
jgi:hypothetical protein